MHKAIWNDEVIAASNEILEIDGNRYFPINSVKKEYLKKSPTHHIDSSKGKADFFNIDVHGNVVWNGAWQYEQPNEKLSKLKNYIAFSSGIDLEDE